MKTQKFNAYFTFALSLLLLILCFQNFTSVSLSYSRFREFFIYDPKLAFQNPNYYAYAPTVINIGQDYHVFSCHNKIAGQVQDHVMYFKYNRTLNTVTKQKITTLAPNPISGSWDGYHVCDPSVVRGAFQFRGTTFKYALFYTGAPFNLSKFNQIGVAFSNSLESETWVRYPYPLIRHPEVPMIYGTTQIDTNKIQNLQDKANPFGVAQPTATSVGGGQILLGYSVGDRYGTRPEVRTLDLSNMDLGPKVSVYRNISQSGLTDTTQVLLNNFDFAYESSSDRFYVIRDGYPNFSLPTPNFLSTSIQIASIEGAAMWSSNPSQYSWRVEGNLKAEQFSNAKRLHNAALVKTEWGQLVKPIQVMTSDAKESENFYEWLFSKRLRLIEILP